MFRRKLSNAITLLSALQDLPFQFHGSTISISMIDSILKLSGLHSIHWLLTLFRSFCETRIHTTSRSTRCRSFAAIYISCAPQSWRMSKSEPPRMIILATTNTINTTFMSTSNISSSLVFASFFKLHLRIFVLQILVGKTQNRS
jgi:hypothetical protein